MDLTSSLHFGGTQADSTTSATLKILQGRHSFLDKSNNATVMMAAQIELLKIADSNMQSWG